MKEKKMGRYILRFELLKDKMKGNRENGRKDHRKTNNKRLKRI